MKKLLILSLGLIAAAAPLSAQNDDQSQPDSQGTGRAPWKKHDKKHGPPGANLTPDERQRLSAAREKAKDDPTVQSLREAREKVGEQLVSAMRSAMLAADPSLGPTLDKIKEARDRAKGMRDKFRSLTPEQGQQLKAAREKAKDDPTVQAAREKMREARGPEAKRAAARELHEAMKAAMLKADPALASLLEQLRPPGPGGFEDGEGPDGPMSPDLDGPPDDPTF
jgi:Spy/CpxP family protein refolding chaperone